MATEETAAVEECRMDHTNGLLDWQMVGEENFSVKRWIVASVQEHLCA